jgi:hypothetical protein
MEMSETSGAREAPSGTVTPAAEFRRWLLVACVLAILTSCGCLALIKVSGGDYRVAFCFWIVFAACEGWIQFDSVGRRCFWTLSGALTGMSLLYIFGSNSGPPPVFWQSLVYLLPASIEFGTAFSVRNRPWIWIVATPLLYGSIGIWVDRVYSVAGSVMESMSGAVRFPMTIPSEISETAAFFGVILIMRAAVGSFIASRKKA